MCIRCVRIQTYHALRTQARGIAANIVESATNNEMLIIAMPFMVKQLSESLDAYEKSTNELEKIKDDRSLDHSGEVREIIDEMVQISRREIADLREVSKLPLPPFVVDENDPRGYRQEDEIGKTVGGVN